MRVNRPRRGVLAAAAASADDYPDAVNGDAVQPDEERGSEHGDAAAAVKCARDSTDSDSNGASSDSGESVRPTPKRGRRPTHKNDALIAGIKRKRQGKSAGRPSDSDVSKNADFAVFSGSEDHTDSSASTHRRGRGHSRGRGLKSPRSSRSRGRSPGHGRGRGRVGARSKGRSSVAVVLKNLPRSVAADRCYGLLAADIDPFITELARLRQGAVALQARCDELGDDAASVTERAELQPLIAKLVRIDAQIHRLALLHLPLAQCATDIAARSACKLCVEIAALEAAKITPQIYDGFENDPNKALLLLMHNTNLRSCPALDRLRQMTQDERAANPAAFERVLDACKAQVCDVVSSILNAQARTTQLSNCYDARDPRAALYSCAACGRRPVAKPSSPFRRIALIDLVQVFEYESVLAASENSTKAAAAALFTRKQIERIASGKRHVDSSGITADKMLDYYESQDCSDGPGGSVTHRCFHLHRQFVDEHVGCSLADPLSATSTTVVPDASCLSCTAAARARLELGATAISEQLAALTAVNDGFEENDSAESSNQAALRSELERLLAQLTHYDELISAACNRLGAGGMSEEAQAQCHTDIAEMRVARVTPVPILVPTRRKLHTHGRAVDEHLGCPCNHGDTSDGDTLQVPAIPVLAWVRY